MVSQGDDGAGTRARIVARIRSAVMSVGQGLVGEDEAVAHDVGGHVQDVLGQRVARGRGRRRARAPVRIRLIDARGLAP